MDSYTYCALGSIWKIQDHNGNCYADSKIIVIKRMQVEVRKILIQNAFKNVSLLHSYNKIALQTKNVQLFKSNERWLFWQPIE